MKNSWTLRMIVLLATFVFLIVGCELILDIASVPGFYFPKPSAIFASLFKEWTWLQGHLAITLYEAIIGFVLALILGVVLSLSYLFIPALEPVVVPIAVAVRNIPFVAISPILFILLGYGPEAKIFIVTLVGFFPIMSNLAAGFASVNRNLIEKFYLNKANRWQTFSKLQLPASIPYFVTGLEISVSTIVISAVVGELLGTTRGMGFVLLLTVSQYKLSLLMAGVVVTTVASIVLTWIVTSITRFSLRRWLAV